MKTNDVLVLNRSWIPIHIVDWKKAMSLIYTENAHAICKEFLSYTYGDWINFSIKADDYNKVRTTSTAIAIPEIIVLTNYNSIPKRDIKFSRQTVFERDKFICQYCGQTFNVKELTMDHIIPKSQGGKSSWLNIVSCCVPCNSRKANRTPVQAGMKLIHSPQEPRWLNPITKLHGKVHICKSWNHFMDRMGSI